LQLNPKIVEVSKAVFYYVIAIQVGYLKRFGGL